MDGGSIEKVLSIEYLVGEILQRIGCTQSLVRSSAVNKLWLSTAQSADIVRGFTVRNKPSFLGFVVELNRGSGREVQLLFPLGGPGKPSTRAMRASFDASSLNGCYVVGSHGGRLICQVAESQGGYTISCPYSKPAVHMLVGFPVPRIPTNTEQHTANTYGQFAVLYRNCGPGTSPAGFFIKDAAGFFVRPYEGVRFSSESSVYVHVCVFKDARWTRFVSEPFIPPPLATFHRNPYCVRARSYFYLMYLVGFIVCFDLEQLSFGVVHLPAEMATTVKSWFEYTVGPHPEGDLAVVHLDNGVLVKWVLVREEDSVDWHVETSVNFVDAFGDIVGITVPMECLVGPSAWSSVQVRSISPDARSVFISVGLNQFFFIVDMLQKRVQQVPNVVQNAVLGRVFPLSEDWPPRP